MQIERRKVGRAWFSWRIALSLFCTSLLAFGCTLGTVTAANAGDTVPSPLVEESFARDTVADSRWVRITRNSDDPPNITQERYRVCLTGQYYSITTGTIPGCGEQLAKMNFGDLLGPQLSLAASTNGLLLLTPAITATGGAILYDVAIPSFAGISIEFDYAAYTSMYSAGGPGDGFSFFLADGSASLTQAGAFGGSLGYANALPDRSGIPNGFLGLGFDWYGNYARDTEGRGTGCDTPSPYTNAGLVTGITLRGPGSGGEGYCWLKTALLGETDLATPVHPDSPLVTDKKQVARETLRDASNGLLRNVKITVSEDEKPTVTVWLDKSGTRQQYAEEFSYVMDHRLPETVKFGFAASTGHAASNILIGDLSAHTLIETNELMLAKQVDPSSQKDIYDLGDEIKYQFTVANVGPDALESVEVTDPYVSDVDCPSTTLTGVGGAYSSMTCMGTYIVAAEDLAEEDGTWSFTNTAQARAITAYSGEPLESNSSSVSVAVDYQEEAYTSVISTSPSRVLLDGSSSSAGITVTIADSSGEPVPGKAVAINSNLGTVGPVTDHNDGTYTASLTSTTAGTATVSYLVNGETATDTGTVTFVGIRDATLTSSDPVVSAIGGSSTITLTMTGTDNQPFISNNVAISLPHGSTGTIGSTTNHNDGTYTATYTSSATVNLDATVRPTVTIGSVTRDTEILVAAISGEINANPEKILANGSSTTDVSVNLVNSSGQPVNRSDLVVTSTAGTITDTSSGNNGLHTATLTSGTAADTATLTLTVNNVTISGSTDVEFVAVRPASLPSLGGVGEWTFLLAGIGTLLLAAIVWGYHYRQAKARHCSAHQFRAD